MHLPPHEIKQEKISIREAAERSGYSTGYLSSLCRTGKIAAKYSEDGWTLDEVSLKRFKAAQAERREMRAEVLKREREEEYRAKRPTKAPDTVGSQFSRFAAASARRAIFNFHVRPAGLSTSSLFARSQFSKTFEKMLRSEAFAVAVALFVVLGGALAAQGAFIPQAVESVAKIASETVGGFDDTFGSVPAHIAERFATVNVAVRAEPARAALAVRSASDVRPLVIFDLSAPPTSGIAEGHLLIPAAEGALLQSERSQFAIHDSIAAAAGEVMAFAAAPVSTLGRAYRALGASGYGAIVGALRAYRALIDGAGDYALALGATTRDALTQAPHLVARMNLALGTAVISATHAAIHADVSIAYATAVAAPASARVTVALIGGMGDVLAGGASRLPALATSAFVGATAMPARVAPAVAEAVFSAEYAVAKPFVAVIPQVTGSYLALVNGTGNVAYASGHKIYNLQFSRFAAASARRAIFNQLSPNYQFSISSLASATEDAFLGALGKSALALDGLTSKYPALAAVQPALTSAEQLALATYHSLHDLFTSTSSALASLFTPAPVVAPAPVTTPARVIALATSTPKAVTLAIASSSPRTYPLPLTPSTSNFYTTLNGVSVADVKQLLASERSGILATVAGMIQPVSTQVATNATTIQQVNMIQDLSNLIVHNGDFRGGTFDTGSLTNGLYVGARQGTFDTLTAGAVTLTTLAAGATTLATTTVTGDFTVTGATAFTGLPTFSSGFLSLASSTITNGLFSMNGGASTTNLTASGTGYFGSSLAIGTSTPDALLSLQQTVNGVPILSAYRVTDSAPSGDFISFKTNSGTTLFRVDNSGNLLAGGIVNSGSQTITSTSQPQFRLQYDPTNELTFSTNSTGTTTLGVNGASGGALVFTPQSNRVNTFNFTDALGTNSVLSIDTLNRRVGIGTTGPTSRLTVGGAIDNTNGMMRIQPSSGDDVATFALWNRASGAAAAARNWMIGSNYQAYGNLDIMRSTSSTGNPLTPVMSLDTNGNVGIGTTSPNALLTIGGSNATGAANGLNFSGDTTANLYRSAAGTIKTDGPFVVGNGLNVTANGVTASFFQSFINNQYLLLGGAGGTGTYYERGATSAAGFAFQAGSGQTGNILQWNNSSGVGLGAIDINGNVGIGTTGPDDKLDVVGTAQITSYLNVGGFIQSNSDVYANIFRSLGAGSASAPVFITNPDPNTGLFFPAADNLAFSTGGAEAVRILSTGNVGIGTTSPVSKLNVVGSGYDNALTYTTYGAGGATRNVNLGGYNSDYGYLGFGAKYYSAGDYTASDGNPGILVSSNGAFTFFSDISKTVGATYTPTPRVTISNGGNVGIGTTGPDDKLDVVGTAQITSYLNVGGFIQSNSDVYANIFRSLGAGSASAPVFITNPDPNTGLFFPAADNLAFSTGGAEAVRILSTGNVGIGTTSPATTLSVQGNGYFSGTGFFGGAITGTSTLNITGLTTLGFASTTQIGSTGSAYFATASGNVGIGTTGPTSKLQVVGSANITDTNAQLSISNSGGSALSYGTNSWITGNGYIWGNTGGVTRMQIWPSGGLSIGSTYAGGSDAGANNLIIQGNVGIGTTSPSTKLHVVGTVTIDSGAGAGAGTINWTTNTMNIAGGVSAQYGQWVRGQNQLLGIDGSAGGIGGLGLYTNGTEKLTVLNGGNVGIGTASPGAKLEVVGNVKLSGTAPWIESQPTAWALPGYIEFGIDENLNVAGNYLTSYVPSGKGFSWAINGASKMLMDSAGNVGIGTTSPIYKLDVVGSGYGDAIVYNGYEAGGVGKKTVVGAWSTNSYLGFGASYSTAGNYIALDTAPTLITSGAGNTVIYADTGKTIGTSYTPTARFEVGSTGNVSMPTGTLTVTGTGNSSFVGNVGIGTTSPVSKLSVVGESAFAGGGVFGLGYAGTAAPSNGLIIQGNVGIGTVGPDRKLDILDASNPQLRLTYTDGSVYADLQADSSGNLKLNPSGTTVYSFGKKYSQYNSLVELKNVFDPDGNSYIMSGNVGIGTTSPAAKLDVWGQGYFNSNIVARSGTLVYPDGTEYIGGYDGSADRAFFFSGTVSGGSVTGRKPMFFDGSTQTFTAGASGAAAMTINSSGNVGIGTTSPVAALDVKAASGLSIISNGTNSNYSFALRNTDTGADVKMDNTGGVLDVNSGATLNGNSSIIKSQNSDTLLNITNTNAGVLATAGIQVNALGGIGNYGVTGSGAGTNGSVYDASYLFTVAGTGLNGMNIAAASSTAGVIRFYTAGTAAANERMRIDKNGNVGIGTTSPSSTLSVQGNAYVSGTSFFGGAIVATSTLNITGLTTLVNASTTQIGSTGSAYFATASGNVGIGTASPGAKLEVVGNVKLSGTAPWIESQPTAWALPGYIEFGIDENLNVAGNYLTSYVPSGKGFSWAINGASKMLMDSAGNVGIGTTTPFSRLSVWGADTGANIMANFVNSASTSVMAILNNGNVGIGTTSPISLLSVYGTSPTITASVSSGTNSSKLDLVNPTNTWTVENQYVGGIAVGTFRIYNGQLGTDAITIHPTTNYVGIGSSTPQAKLSVKGNGSTTGLLAQFSDNANAARVTILDNGNVGIGTTSPVSLLSLGNGTGAAGTTAALGMNFGDPLANLYRSAAGTIKTDGVFIAASSLNGASVSVSTSNAGVYTALARINNSAVASNITGTSVSFEGTINFVPMASVGGMWEEADTLNGSLIMKTRGNDSLTEKMRILGTGNVGIGTTSPATTLSVQGNGYFSGTGFFGGAITGTSTLNITGLTTLGFASTTQIGSTGSAYFATASGNVGIGTTNPVTKLHVKGSTAAGLNEVLRLEAGTDTASPASGPALTFGMNSASYPTWLLSQIGSTQTAATWSGDLVFYTNNGSGPTDTTEKMRILNNGNVGIGTTTPYSRLSVWGAGTGATSMFELTNSASTSLMTVLNNGNVGIGTTAPADPLVVVGANDSTPLLSLTTLHGTTDFQFSRSSVTGALSIQGLQVGNNNILLAPTSGNVGIGITNPVAKFSVQGADAGGNEGMIAKFSRDGAGAEKDFYISSTNGTRSNLSSEGGLSLRTGVTADLPYSTGVDALTILSTGNVGIGTTSPVSKLSVVGESALAGGLSVGLGYAGTAAPSNGLIIQGNVGIGTTNPTTPLHVRGANFSSSYPVNIIAEDTTAFAQDVGGGIDFKGKMNATTGTADFGMIQGAKENGTSDNTAGYLRFFTNPNNTPTEKMRITSAGNVGIGTTSPFALLSVAGSGFFNGNLTAANITATGTLAVTGQTTLGYASSTGLTVSGSTYLATTNGNVGIGTTNPIRNMGNGSPMLDISGSGNSVLVIHSSGAQESSIVAGSGLYIDTAGSQTASNNFITFRTAPANSSYTLVEAMRITSGGNVGIGTTSPWGKLSVTGAGTGTGIGFLVADSANSPKMVVLDNGNVGIGTTSPVSKLSVVGESALAGGLSVGLGYAGTAAPSNGLIIQGNVGIGTPSPNGKLDVKVAANQHFQISDLSGVTFLSIANDANNANTPFRLDASQTVLGMAGNVGIGTTSPLSKLSIQGSDTTSANSALNVTDVSGASKLFVRNDGNVGIGSMSPVSRLFVDAGDSSSGAPTTIGFGNITAGQAVQFSIGGSGNVLRGGAGLRTQLNSYWGLDLYGNAQGATVPFNVGGSEANVNIIGTQTSTKGLVITGAPGQTVDLFQVASSSASTVFLNVSNTGNVGIGTTSPATKLEVGGNTANVTLDGYLNCAALTSNANGLLGCTPSDERMKQGIAAIATSSALAGINALNPVSFFWKNPSQGVEQQFGLIAQQVQGVFPNLIQTTNPTELTPDGTLTVNYYGLIAPMIRSIQELDARTRQILGSDGVLSLVPGVESQCVTGDTRLRRRRKKADGSYEFDEVGIADVVEGDEIQSLDEAAAGGGRVVYSRVNALIDMGEQEVYELVTKSGRRIRTTGNHPFLARER